MNADGYKFKSILSEAIQESGLREGAFRHKYNSDELFNDVFLDADSPNLIAAKAIKHLCSDDGQFNGCVPGLMAVTTFLREKGTKGPSAEEEELCLMDLATRDLDDHNALLGWVNQWYSF